MTLSPSFHLDGGGGGGGVSSSTCSGATGTASAGGGRGEASGAAGGGAGAAAAATPAIAARKIVRVASVAFENYDVRQWRTPMLRATPLELLAPPTSPAPGHTAI